MYVCSACQLIKTNSDIEQFNWKKRNDINTLEWKLGKMVHCKQVNQQE